MDGPENGSRHAGKTRGSLASGPGGVSRIKREVPDASGFKGLANVNRVDAKLAGVPGSPIVCRVYFPLLMYRETDLDAAYEGLSDFVDRVSAADLSRQADGRPSRTQYGQAAKTKGGPVCSEL